VSAIFWFEPPQLCRHLFLFHDLELSSLSTSLCHRNCHVWWRFPLISPCFLSLTATALPSQTLFSLLRHRWQCHPWQCHPSLSLPSESPVAVAAPVAFSVSHPFSQTLSPCRSPSFSFIHDPAGATMNSSSSVVFPLSPLDLLPHSFLSSLTLFHALNLWF